MSFPSSKERIVLKVEHLRGYLRRHVLAVAALLSYTWQHHFVVHTQDALFDLPNEHRLPVRCGQS